MSLLFHLEGEEYFLMNVTKITFLFISPPQTHDENLIFLLCFFILSSTLFHPNKQGVSEVRAENIR